MKESITCDVGQFVCVKSNKTKILNNPMEICMQANRKVFMLFYF